LRSVALAGAFVTGLLVTGEARCQPADAAPWLYDRGTGVRTSIFGTYVRSGELLVSPFFEYYIDDDFEYKPAELGYGLDQDFRGRFRASEGLIFLSYGFSERLAIEFEAAVISSKLDKAPDDSSSMPQRIKESGQGDWQMQLDWRMLHETKSRPEVFGYLEIVFPSNKSKPLIGTPDFEYKGGVGVTRGMSWGTLTARVAAEYSQADKKGDLGEYAVEYLKRLSRSWRVYAGIEGTQDEVELIGEAQWHLSDRVYVRFNTGYGLSSKATDWAPDVGVVFSVPLGGAAR
jgi:hypothetical protein